MENYWEGSLEGYTSLVPCSVLSLVTVTFQSQATLEKSDGGSRVRTVGDLLGPDG